jgi:hypothetical protein
MPPASQRGKRARDEESVMESGENAFRAEVRVGLVMINILRKTVLRFVLQIKVARVLSMIRRSPKRLNSEWDGGGGGIRTLDTGFGPYNGLANG